MSHNASEVFGDSVIRQVSEVLARTEGLTVHYDPPTEDLRPGVFASVGDLGVPAQLEAWIRARYPHGLFSHQVEAIRRLASGQNVVVATPTSSGKSLIFSIPILSQLLKDSKSTAMCIYPQKALANDQLIKLRESARNLRGLDARFKEQPNLIARYDGGVDGRDRDAIRKQVQVLLTNPDMLHLGILSQHSQHWSRFFKNLRCVIIDECHEYRGIFGSNVAYVVRRLRQVCKRYGASPVFVAASATVSAPQTHLEKLTGLPFSCVGPECDGSIQGRKKFWMVSPKDGNYFELGRTLGLSLARRGLTVLVFCPSRLSAEMATSRIIQQEQEEFVRVYRAGLSAAEREEIEEGLRNRTVRLVFSTNALELGIDIGAIDAVVCIGLPSSMMSLRQRMGRAARAGKEGAVVLIPADSPIDSHYAAHPGELFARDNEPLALNLNNRRVMHAHYACAAQEYNGDEDRLDFDLLGPELGLVHKQRAEGELNDDVFYRSSPHAEINLRNMGSGQYSLKLDNAELGDIDESHLHREAYPNAIYRHGGRTYRVLDVRQRAHVVRLKVDRSGHETTPVIQKRIRLKSRSAVSEYPSVMLAKVDIDVTERLIAVIEKAHGKVLHQFNSGGLRDYCLPTVGTLLLLKRPLWNSIATELGDQAVVSALESCERLMASLFPTIDGPCDARDYSSASEVNQGQAAIYLYDFVYDGVDLTTCAFDRMDDLLRRVKEQVDRCTCVNDSGCFRCVANPRTDKPASKKATRRLLDLLLSVMENEEPCFVRSEDLVASSRVEEKRAKCVVCEAPMQQGDRFCSNCGQKAE